jgi:hypothetical protein
MKNSGTQQEILFFINTKFSSFDWQKKNDETTNLSQIEKIEEACWNGLLGELLPELLQTHSSEKMSLWNINKASSFLDLQYSNYPLKLEEKTSLNPYIFVDHLHLN